MSGRWPGPYPLSDSTFSRRSEDASSPTISGAGFADIENVVAIKIAPFNRYQTLDVVRAVAESGRADDIALYTGNDDNIVMDLLTEFAVRTVRRTRASTHRGRPSGPLERLDQPGRRPAESAIRELASAGAPVPNPC